jgi:hypothetical protein
MVCLSYEPYYLSTRWNTDVSEIDIFLTGKPRPSRQGASQPKMLHLFAVVTSNELANA